MKNKSGKLLGITLTAILGLAAISSLAQERQPQRERQPAPDRMKTEIDMIERAPLPAPDGPLPPGPPAPPPEPGDFIFLATEMSFGGKLVKGAPYSAQSTTESTQVLSDGNRIVNKSSAMLYRDSEGRTRREQTLRAIGSMASSGEPAQTIFISDPVAETSYTLDTRSQVARKMPPFRFNFEFKRPGPEKEKAAGTADRTFHYEIQPDVLVDKRTIESGAAMGWFDKRNPSAKTESLGIQNVGGVNAEGTRSTVTIPAGEIGNERPIEIVNERWYSPELQMIVMTRHSDPRSGETVYRLTNIDRSEPARSLFEVPADYTVKEGPERAPLPMRARKPAGIPE